MSYVTYTTEALVCGSFNRATADRSFLLFTREAGMLYAEARSVREERSRQRYALQDFSQVRVSLVKGKQVWRVGSALPLENDYYRATDKAARGSIALVYRLVRRFVTGESVDPALYDFVVRGLSVLAGTLTDRSRYETLFTYRLLARLGYVDTSRSPQTFLDDDALRLPETFDAAAETSLKMAIDRAITHSHL